MSDYIPEEIQVKIMKLLPVDSLLRCRCVCKWWKQEIDSQSFVQEHLAFQKPRVILQYEATQYLVADPHKLPSFDILSWPLMDEQLFIVGTLHGIVCLYGPNCRIIMLWNPWTRNVMTVIPMRQQFNWYNVFYYAPSSGFWIDPSTKEFKIITFQLFGDPEENHVCEMYSSVLGDWKMIPMADELAYHYTKELAPALVMDGVAHWTVYCDNTEPDGTEMIAIVVIMFDFIQEVFLETIHAIDIYKGSNRPVLCSRDGVLSLVYTNEASEFHILSRKEGEWVKVRSFFVFPVLDKYLWRVDQVEDNQRKNRVLAAILGGLLSFKAQDILICSPLMMQIREVDHIFIANDFVPSLLFPVTHT